jgi:hypothetical protein
MSAQTLMRHCASGIEQITTGLAGTLPDHRGGKQALSDFEMELDQDGNVTEPFAQPVSQRSFISASHKSFKLVFTAATCQACAFYQADQCPIQTNKRKACSS